MKRLFLLALAATALSAQTGAIVNQTDGPPPEANSKVFGYSGTDLVYVCTARSFSDQRQHTRVSVSAISKAAAAVVTSTGHGFPLAARPTVTISGATGTGWVTGINGTFTATVIDANTFSVPVDSSLFGTLAGTVVFTTTAPRLTVSEWSVEKLAYTGGVLEWIGWLNGKQSMTQKCSDGTSTTLNQQ